MFKKLQPFDESNFWKNTEKFMFISSQPASEYQINLTFKLLYSFGVLNMITVDPHKNHFRVFSYNPYFENEVLYEINSFDTNSTIIFEDKKKDMYGYKYKVLKYEEPLLYFFQNYMFLIEMCKIQNASMVYQKTLRNRDKNFLKTYSELMITKQVDLTLNTAVKSTLNYMPLPSVITYDEVMHCALVPKPPRTSFFALILKPFDLWTWLTIVITVVVCAIVWRLFRLLYPHVGNSTWYFVYGVFANFLGQSLNFRANHKKQVLLVQLCMLMTFIFGNTYQSMLTTFMTESRNGKRLNTLDELLKSDFILEIDPIFYDLIKHSENFSNFEQRVTEISLQKDSWNFIESSKGNIAIILRCVASDLMFDNLNTTVGPNDYYYVLPERFYKLLSNFELSDDSPYESIFQHYSNLVFESGIKQHWEHVMSKLADNRIAIERRFLEDEEYLLKIEDLQGIFVAWLISLLVCTLDFLLEVFLHKYTQKSNCWMAKKASSKKTEKTRLQKIKIIQVRPGDIIDLNVQEIE